MKEAEFLAFDPIRQNRVIHEKMDLDEFCCPKCSGIWFGSTIADGEITERHCHGPPYGCGWSGPPKDAYGDYVGSWDAMRLVVEKMREEGWHPMIMTLSGEWYCSMRDGSKRFNEDEAWGTAEAPTAPLAVAIAAGKAQGWIE
jgi:hypothetical protein